MSAAMTPRRANSSLADDGISNTVPSVVRYGPDRATSRVRTRSMTSARRSVWHHTFNSRDPPANFGPLRLSSHSQK